MKQSTRRFALLATLLAGSAAACAVNPKDQAGWTSLMDANAWRGYLKQDFPAGWEFANGELKRVGAGGDIITKETYENFELDLEWQISVGGNSGIFYGVKEDPALSAVYLSGPEFQIIDNEGHRDGAEPLTSAGSNFAVHFPVRDVTRDVGEWNRTRIIVRGNHVETWLNGTKTVDYELGSADWRKRVSKSKFKDWPEYGMTRNGHIALQDHGDPVAFRNIRIRRY
jgi:hypothetical protein